MSGPGSRRGCRAGAQRPLAGLSAVTHGGVGQPEDAKRVSKKMKKDVDSEGEEVGKGKRTGRIGTDKAYPAA